MLFSNFSFFPIHGQKEQVNTISISLQLREQTGMSSLTKTTYKRGLETPSMSRHDDYLHAPLQLFHHAVKLDMQNMNLGESWWFKKNKNK